MEIAKLSYTLIVLNYVSFFITMLGEQGVPQSVYERYYRIQYLKNDNKQ